jgi:peptidoglycan/LPS O-acetylase OafA/YrhL
MLPSPEKRVPSQEPTQRFAFLDALRGLAAFAVFLGHFFMGFGLPPFVEAYLRKTTFSLLWDGLAGVSIFFVLSGFVLSYRPLRPGASHRFPVARFYAARAFRLYIPYWLSLVLSLLCWRYLFVHFATEPPGDTIFFYARWLTAQTPSFSTLIGEFSMLHPLGFLIWIPQAWTLMAELYLSLLLPWLLILLKSRPRLFYATACVLLLFSGVQESFAILRAALFHFMLGIALAAHYPALARRSLFRRRHVAWAGLVVACVLLNFHTFPNLLFDWFGGFDYRLRYVAALGAALAIAVLIGQPAFARVLETRPLRFLGRISYSLYLCQYLVLFIFTPRCLILLNGLGMGADSARLVALAASTGALLLLSHTLWWLAEQPSVQLGRWIRNAAPR